MTDAEVHIGDTAVDGPEADDVEMTGAENAANDSTTAEAGAVAETGATEEETGLTTIQADEPERITFLDYLKSPIVELVVGTDDNKTVLAAHQGLLMRSPYLAGLCAKFNDENVPRRIEFPSEDLDAVGSVLEFLYNDEYFPRRIGGTKDGALEHDGSVPEPDDTGIALLRHARIYTLASKFDMPALKSLAHSKIHRTPSNARGEIAYARYIYKETDTDDVTIRRPVAAFWATRSHVLRHEAEAEFRAMCLEYPQFGFDVLNLVLDQKEKKSFASVAASAEPMVLPASSERGDRSTRKRARVSQI